MNYCIFRHWFDFKSPATWHRAPVNLTQTTAECSLWWRAPWRGAPRDPRTTGVLRALTALPPPLTSLLSQATVTKGIWLCPTDLFLLEKVVNNLSNKEIMPLEWPSNLEPWPQHGWAPQRSCPRLFQQSFSWLLISIGSLIQSTLYSVVRILPPNKYDYFTSLPKNPLVENRAKKYTLLALMQCKSCLVAFAYCSGLNCVSTKFICWSPSLAQDLTMWLYLQIGPLKR